MPLLRVFMLVLLILLAVSTTFLLELPKNLTPFDTFPFFDIKSSEVKFLGTLVSPLRPNFSRISTLPSELVLGSLLFLPTYVSGGPGGYISFGIQIVFGASSRTPLPSIK